MSGQWSLAAHPHLSPPTGPVALIILDGVGAGEADEGNAWTQAKTPYLDHLFSQGLVGQLRAHGKAVGMPSNGDMGNSEVGHNALGAGRVFDQGAKLVDMAVASGNIFRGETWSWLMEACQQGGTLHLIGLWSDGNVHSHVNHAYALMQQAIEQGVGRIRVHPLIDGRDVGECSALEYLRPLEEKLGAWRRAGSDIRVASGGGRMVTTMDRYGAEWPMVERGWCTHVLGEGRGFASSIEAIETYRSEHPGIIDQRLPPFVITDERGPVGTIEDGDAVIFFNFRGDRAVEITQAFEAGPTFDRFDRRRVPRVRYAGMMQYDGDLNLPSRFLVDPPSIDRTVGAYLAHQGLRQLAISETQKYGHVTYFYNGNRSGQFDASLERYVEIPSDVVEFNERPWMKAKEITDDTLSHIDAFSPHFIRVNYANGDMVGHTGDLEASITAMEVIDQHLPRLVNGIIARGGRCIITADHGNCEEMYEKDKKTGLFLRDTHGDYKSKTSHTLNPVPCAIVGAGLDGAVWAHTVDAPGVANLAATSLNLLGFSAPEDYVPGVVSF